MQEQILQQYLNQQINNCVVFFQKTQKEFNREVLHKARLSVKKLKAIAKFLNYYLPPKQKIILKSLLKEVKELYRAGGSVRDLQVLELVIASYQEKNKESYSELIEKIEQLKKQNYQKFELSITKINLDKIQNAQHQLYKLLDPINPNEILKHQKLFIVDLIASIKEAFNDLKTEETVHDIRKNLKSTNYMLGLLKKQLCPNEKEKNTMKKLKQIGEEIGIWHDRVVLKDFINQSKFKKTDKYIQLKNQLKNQNKEFLIQLPEKLNNEFNVILPLLKKTPPENKLEIESKLSFSNQTAPEIKKFFTKTTKFLDYKLKNEQKIQLSDTYYDTDNFLLLDKKCSLRLRKKESQFLITFKQSLKVNKQIGLFTRNEFEKEPTLKNLLKVATLLKPLVTPDNEITEEVYLKQGINGIFSVFDIYEKFTNKNNRTTKDIYYNKKKIAELIFDEVTCIIDDQTMNYCEIEIEFTEKTQKHAKKIVEYLKNQFPEKLETIEKSKYRKGVDFFKKMFY